MSLSKSAQAIIQKCKLDSEAGISAMRESAWELFGNRTDFIIGVNGSYARREVTSGSDVDLFFLTDGIIGTVEVEQEKYNKRLIENGLKMPAAGGVFETPLSIAETMKQIGGMGDTNLSITRRMLLLLEGEWVFNKSGFDETRGNLINCYVSDGRRVDQICMFLLNDIIRYWRTICVDFEYKVNNDGKPKAIRLIKLRFSRMMLYLAGILAVGETYNKTSAEKRETLTQLFAMPGIERFQHIVGSKGDQILELYAVFLEALDAVQVRQELEILGAAGINTKEYEELRQCAHEFRDKISELLVGYCDNGNPMLTALML